MQAQLRTFLLLVSPIILSAAPPDTTAACDRVTVTIELPKPTRIVAIRLDYTTFPDVGAAYKIHDEALTWDEANERCKSEYTLLAIPDTVEKIGHINNLRNSDQTNDLLHVGIRKSNTTTDEWVRVDNGLPVTSLPWTSPNLNPTEGCAGVLPSGNTLVSYPCDRSRQKFVCGVTLTETWHQ